MTPEESKAALSTLLDSIQEEAGGEWSSTVLEARECSLTGMSRPGVQWAMARNAPGAGDMESARAATEKVSAMLEGAGYEVTPAGFHEVLGYDLRSNNGAGSEVGWLANGLSMEILAGSNCVEGDVDELGRGDPTN